MPTIDALIGHWTPVNATLSPQTLVLSGSYAIAGLSTARYNLTNAMNQTEVSRQ